MSTFASGDVQIYLESEEDAKKLREALSKDNISEEFERVLGEKGKGSYTFYDFDEDEESESVEFKVCSDRVQNAEWQVDNLGKYLKKLVKDKEIETVLDFKAELMTQYAGWSMEESEFHEDEDEEGYEE